jgi:pyruvate dehydrogenase E2 component (dihydrolipoamide acetyltransferase)
MPDLTMPRLSDSMEQATIVSWLVADGDEVTTGQELAEVETDKATVTFEAEADGVIQLLAGVGETVALGAVIARITAPGEQPVPSRTADDPFGRNGDQAAVAVQTTTGPEARTQRTADRANASPVARRLASTLEIDLHAVNGTGPRGRIVRTDVERAAAARTSAPAAQPETSGRQPAAPAARRLEAATQAATGSASAKGSSSVHELSRTQQVIARRMAESRATVPDFDVSVEVDMETAWGLRAQLKGQLAPEPAPSLNDMVVMATARALAEQREANSAYRDGHIERFERINIGVAVACEGALVVPTVTDADRRSLGEIARATRELAGKVRDGSITPAELAGGTFTVSNLGMFGVDVFTAVINPPQAAILAVGAVKQRAVVVDGNLEARRTMLATLAADHRVLYGADAARLVARIRALLEQPLALLAG